MLQIVEAESLEEGTRHLIIEFVIMLAEARERAPGMMRKLLQFITRLFAILMKMFSDVEYDPAWHSAETKDEDAGETSNYSVGQEYLDRFAIALSGNTIVLVAFEQLQTYMAASEWQKHHSALIALAQITEDCSNVTIKNLEQVVNMVLNSFKYPHPRVRWASINAIGQRSTDLGPDLQVQYHQRVLPALAVSMDAFQNPRVQIYDGTFTQTWKGHLVLQIMGRLRWIPGSLPNLHDEVFAAAADTAISVSSKSKLKQGANPGILDSVKWLKGKKSSKLANISSTSKCEFSHLEDIFMRNPFLESSMTTSEQEALELTIEKKTEREKLFDGGADVKPELEQGKKLKLFTGKLGMPHQ